MDGSYPRERILAKRLVERVQRQREEGRIPIESEMLYMVCLLLADRDGNISKEAYSTRAWDLLEQGHVEVRPFEDDPDYVRVSYRPHASHP